MFNARKKPPSDAYEDASLAQLEQEEQCITTAIENTKRRTKKNTASNRLAAWLSAVHRARAAELERLGPCCETCGVEWDVDPSHMEQGCEDCCCGGCGGRKNWCRGC